MICSDCKGMMVRPPLFCDCHKIIKLVRQTPLDEYDISKALGLQLFDTVKRCHQLCLKGKIHLLHDEAGEPSHYSSE